MTDKTTDLILENKPVQGKRTDIQNPELWHFPMDYPLSIIGHEGETQSLLDEVKLIMGSNFPEQVNKLYKALDEAKTIRTVL